ncbi:MAG: hypothetical protein H0T18_05705 [Chloroflexia bacterium]|nr:hypothetical protein [Chloroflexia bacterium]
MNEPGRRRHWHVRTALFTMTLLVMLAGRGAALGQQEDPVIEAELARIANETAILRQLPALDRIDDVLMSRAELQAIIPELIAQESDPAQVAAEARSLAAIGLIPEGIDLVDLTVRLMGEQAAGFYDPLTDEMLVVSDGEETLGIEQYFYAHEIVHALQDAYLDPEDLMEELTSFNSDASLAQLALYEGDAVSASNDYLANHPALVLAILQEVGADFPELDQAPATVGISLLFPYVSGVAFVDRLRAEGGWDAVDAAYADMPESTEQILHPLKYLDRDAPATLALPKPADAIGEGWRTVDEDTLGELQIAVLLAGLAPGAGINGITGEIDLPEAARNAAAGWDGDRFALWEDENGEREILIWRSVWDTPQDARAFSRALAQFGNERWGSVFNGESADDVALVTPDIAARILLDGQHVLYVQAPALPLADAALAVLQSAPAPDPAPGPD